MARLDAGVHLLSHDFYTGHGTDRSVASIRRCGLPAFRTEEAILVGRRLRRPAGDQAAFAVLGLPGNPVLELGSRQRWAIIGGAAIIVLAATLAAMLFNPQVINQYLILMRSGSPLSMGDSDARLPSSTAIRLRENLVAVRSDGGGCRLVCALWHEASKNLAVGRSNIVVVARFRSDGSLRLVI